MVIHVTYIVFRIEIVLHSVHNCIHTCLIHYQKLGFICKSDLAPLLTDVEKLGRGGSW